MSSRSSMTMRATVMRNQAQADAYGQPGPADWRLVAHVPCRAWQGAASRSQAAVRVIEADEHTLLVPLDADVVAEDRVDEVYDGRGELVVDQVLYVNAVRRRRTHLEVECRGSR